MKIHAIILALAAAALAAPTTSTTNYDVSSLSTAGRTVVAQLANLNLSSMSADQIKAELNKLVTEDVPADEVSEMEEAIDEVFGLNQSSAKRGEHSVLHKRLGDQYCCDECECLTGCTLM